MSENEPMLLSERVAMLEGNLARQLQLVGSVEGRSGLILALSTAMLGMLAAQAPRAAAWTVASALWAMGASLGLVASLGFLCASSFPRTVGPPGSIVFFEGIASRSADQYRQCVASISLKSYADDLALQCHRNGEIAKSKFGWLRASMTVLYLSVLPWAIAVFKLYQGHSR